MMLQNFWDTLYNEKKHDLHQAATEETFGENIKNSGGSRSWGYLTSMEMFSLFKIASSVVWMGLFCRREGCR